MKNLLLVFVCVMFFYVMPVGAQNQSVDTEFTAAVIKEQDVTFAVVLVKGAVFDDKNFADGLIDSLEPSFGGIPVVLMVQDAQGTPTYYGRKDLSEFLSKVPVESLPWQKYVLRQTGTENP